MSISLVASMLAAMTAQGTAAADRPAVLSQVVACRTITDEAARLACFDRSVAALDAAESSQELVVVTRDEVRRTRRGLFGLTLPDLGIFGDATADAEAVREIEDVVRSASTTPYGRWILTLENGQVWTQTDTRRLPIEPRAGHPIRIRRAALGSYMANVNDQLGMRVQRTR